MKKKTHGMRSELKIHGKKHEKRESAKFEKKEKKMEKYKK
jgi:hypothetical protein